MANKFEMSSKSHLDLRRRECLNPRCSAQAKTATSPADASKTPVVAILNNRWRVIDDPLQWILQVRRGRKTEKATGWRGRSYCTQRTVLLRCIREYCGEVDADALAIVEALPNRHIDWKRSRKRR